jgi:hypothetical protein
MAGRARFDLEACHLGAGAGRGSGDLRRGRRLAFVRDAVLPAVLSAPDAKAWQGRLAPQLRFEWYWWVIWILAALLIVVLEGAFRVIRKEGRDAPTERKGLTAQIGKLEAERLKPDFVGTIPQAIVGHEEGQPPTTPVVVTLSPPTGGRQALRKITKPPPSWAA